MKKYHKFTQIIQGAAKRDGYSIRSLSKMTGIPYPTFIKRLADPGMWRFCEIQGLFSLLNFYPDEEKEIRKELGLKYG